MAHTPSIRASLAAALGLALASYVLCLLPPLRAAGGDTVPGRLGAAALACTGSSDLRSITWVDTRAHAGALPYWAHVAPDGALVSTFGPAPAWLGLPAMRSLPRGALVGDRALVRRARYASAGALAASTGLLALALCALCSLRRALVLASATAASFAGVGTLGQALWQQTALLPVLAAALATLAWGRRDARWLALTPALATAALYVRPAALGIVLALGAAWWLSARANARIARLALALGAIVLIALASASLTTLGTPLPLGQWGANEAASPDGRVLDPSPTHVLVALAGLLASPARGALFFAPALLLALALGWTGRRDPARVLATCIAAGIAAHLVVCALFWKWWGGLAFGPRLLAEAVWVAPLALTDAARRASIDRLLAAALIVTAMVGALGAARYDARAWDTRRDPDHDPSALWDPLDSPLAAIVSFTPPEEPLRDAPNGPFVYCAGEPGVTLR